MINRLLRIIDYTIVFVLIQVMLLNNLHFLLIATPFLYLYIILKLPIQTSTVQSLIIAFLVGILIDMFSNTPGMHAAASTLIGFIRPYILQIFIGKDIPENTVIPSYEAFGFAVFTRYTFSLVFIHSTCLLLIESLSLFDPLFLMGRIISCSLLTCLLVLITETFYLHNNKNAEQE